MAIQIDNFPSPLVSIIVPIYNVEQYLPACLDSILAQTLQSIEVICVNDCSLDNSLTVMNEYAQKDARIKIVSHAQNKGLGPARNTGVEAATAPYILFVDSDDVVEETMAEKLYSLMVENNADMSWCNIGSMTEDGYIRRAGEYIPAGIYTPASVLESAQLYQTLLPVWNKMYKRAMIKDVKQLPIVSEDQPFLSMVLGRCNSIAVTSETYYYYRNRRGTLSKPKLHTSKSWDAFFYAHKLFFEKLPQGKVTTKGLYVQCVKRYFSLFWRIRTFSLIEQQTWEEQRKCIFEHIVANDIPIKRYCIFLYGYLCYVFAKTRSKHITQRLVHFGYDLSAYISRGASFFQVGWYIVKRIIKRMSHQFLSMVDMGEQLFFHLLSKFVSKKIWLIGERLNTYQDNGMYFFKYMIQYHPEVQSYYVIDKEHIDSIGGHHTLVYNSFKHKLYFCAAQVYANAHYDATYPRTSLTHKRYNQSSHTLNVFLQHGITYSSVGKFYGKESSDIDVFICAVPIEQQVAIRDFGYSKNEAALTGFARFDGLNDNVCPKRQVLLMPTWRRDLCQCSLTEFTNTEYYKVFHSLLVSPYFAQWLSDTGLQLLFAPHYEMTPFLQAFSDVQNDHIRIIDSSKYSVQRLLKDALVLITDVSSVQFDFAYMRKPLLYYHWDYTSIVANHLGKGYFDFERNGFGAICSNEDSVLQELNKIANDDWKMEDKYLSRVNQFFCYRDSNNCQRIYQAIQKRL